MTLHVTPLVSDGCMIQRDQPFTIWGTGASGRTISIELIDDSQGRSETVTSTVADDGRWETTLFAYPAGTHATIIVDDGTEQAIVRDVLFGDVWILAGQSNMELWMGRLSVKFPNEPTDPDDRIRFFNVPQTCDFEREHDDLDSGTWASVDRDSIADLSGIGYFFAKRLRADANVPIGLIRTAIGGSKIETWMSRSRLESMGLLPDDFGRLDSAYVERQQRLYASASDQWERESEDADAGNDEHWESPSYDDTDWDTMPLTDPERPELKAPGVIWLRKRVTVEDRFVGRPAQLRFGTFIDADRMYLDGTQIGETGYRYPPRNYTIEALPKTFTLAIRLKVEGRDGGFTFGKHHVIVADAVDDLAAVDEPGRAIDIDAMGEWRFRRSLWMPAKPAAEFFLMQPVGSYNAMIVPLRRLALTGVLWYQGESNTWHPHGYAARQITLMQDWRTLFGQPELPFIYAQLPNHQLDGKELWPYMRDEQRRALALPGTAMVTTYDAGEDDDLHPLDKKTVADRMALAAEALVYGSKREYMGPMPSQVQYSTGCVTVRFSHIGDGLRAVGPLEFTVMNGAGLPRAAVFQGRITAKDRVVIDMPDCIDPGRDARLRFLWDVSPRPALVNSEGLLASPFDMPIDA